MLVLTCWVSQKWENISRVWSLNCFYDSTDSNRRFLFNYMSLYSSMLSKNNLYSSTSSSSLSSSSSSCSFSSLFSAYYYSSSSIIILDSFLMSIRLFPSFYSYSFNIFSVLSLYYFSWSPTFLSSISLSFPYNAFCFLIIPVFFLLLIYF